MGGIAEREEQADGGAFHPLRPQFFGCAQRRIFIELMNHMPVGADSFFHFEAQVARHERLRQINAHVVQPAVRPLDPGDLQHIAEAGGGDQPHLGAAAFDERVRADRGAVGEVVDGIHRDPGHRQDALDAAQDALGEVARGGQFFDGEDAVLGIIDQDKVGEGSTYINAQSHRALPSTVRAAARHPPTG